MLTRITGCATVFISRRVNPETGQPEISGDQMTGSGMGLTESGRTNAGKLYLLLDTEYGTGKGAGDTVKVIPRASFPGLRKY